MTQFVEVLNAKNDKFKIALILSLNVNNNFSFTLNYTNPAKLITLIQTLFPSYGYFDK